MQNDCNLFLKVSHYSYMFFVAAAIITFDYRGI